MADYNIVVQKINDDVLFELAKGDTPENTEHLEKHTIIRRNNLSSVHVYKKPDVDGESCDRVLQIAFGQNLEALQKGYVYMTKRARGWSPQAYIEEMSDYITEED